MPYPAKTDRATILAAAVAQVSRTGLRDLSLRGLATELGLAPNALYRYFADRAALEAALTAESARVLHASLEKAAGKLKPEAAIRAVAKAYLRFARENRHLYDMMLLPCSTAPDEAAIHEAFWAFTLQLVTNAGFKKNAPEAAVALWAVLHGIASLEAAHVFGAQKPFTGLDFALNAWLASAKAHSTSDARPGSAAK